MAQTAALARTGTASPARRSLAEAGRQQPEAPPPGWYSDPGGPGLRYWDGGSWTSDVYPALDAAAPAVAPRIRVDVPATPTASIQRTIRARAQGRPPAPPLQGMRRLSRRHLRWAVDAVCVVSALVLVLFGWELVGTNVQGDLGQQHLREELVARTPLAAAPIPPHTAGRAGTLPPMSSIPGMPPTGAPVGTISIPEIGLNYAFSSGTGEAQLAVGPGLWRYGSFPGTPGNTTISGHRTTHGGFFANLANLRYGDRIDINVPGEPQAVYAVRGAAVVLPGNVMVTNQTGGVRLTLTACTPSGWATNRLVIEAELVSGSWVAKSTPASQWKTLAPPGDAVPLAQHPGETVAQLDPTAR